MYGRFMEIPNEVVEKVSENVMQISMDDKRSLGTELLLKKETNLLGRCKKP